MAEYIECIEEYLDLVLSGKTVNEYKNIDSLVKQINEQFLDGMNAASRCNAINLSERVNFLIDTRSYNDAVFYGLQLLERTGYKYEEAYYLAAKAYFRLHDFKSSIEYCNKGLELFKYDPRLYTIKAEDLLFLGEFSEAREHAEKSMKLSLSKGDIVCGAVISSSYFLSGNNAEGMKYNEDFSSELSDFDWNRFKKKAQYFRKDFRRYCPALRNDESNGKKLERVPRVEKENK